MDLEQIWVSFKPTLMAVPGKLAISFAVILIVTLIIRLLHFIIDRTLDGRLMTHDLVAQNIRTKTLRSILKSLVTYALYIFALLYIITIFVGPLGLTLTSIGGVALGFGAQSFIKDIIAGTFILMENKFQIGDFIKVGSWQGTVEDIGLRTTMLRDLNGDLHSLPNGNIQEVTNVSRGDRRFMVDVLIPDSDDLERAARLLEDVSEVFKTTHDQILEGPAYLGIVNIRDIGATLRVQGRAEFVHHWNYENDLRRDILKRFKEEGIRTGVRLSAEGGMVK